MAGLLTGLAACGSVKLTQPTPDDLKQAQVIYPDMTLEEMQESKMLVEQNCTRCHGLKTAFQTSNEELAEVLPKMVNGANKKAGQVVIDEAKKDQIYRYMVVVKEKGKA